MLEKKDLQKFCLVGGALSIAAGAAGMVLSFVYLSSASMADVTAGASGFVAGAFLIGSGLVACTLVATLGAGTSDATSRTPVVRGVDPAQQAAAADARQGARG